jgi:hypothetical protein
MKNRNIMCAPILLALGFFALCPIAQAVEPSAPETALPGGNTADGHLALASVTTGLYDSAFGIYSLLSLTDGNFCTGVGAGTLLANTANENTATGAGALLSNTTGGNNTADGAFALFSNTAAGNTAIGARALLNNTTGGTIANVQGIDVGPNVAVGWQALESNTVASANTAVGYQALHSFTTGPVGFEQFGLSTAVGFQALANATTGFGNSGFGYQALFNNTEGAANTAVGFQALFNNTLGGANVAAGNNALLHNSAGSDNTAIGVGAMEVNVDGSDNTAIGSGALRNVNVGDGNTAVGAAAGNNSGGANNTMLGASAGLNATTASNVICIGANVIGADVSNSCYIGNIFGQSVDPATATFAIVDTNGKLGTQLSSRRFKQDIKPMDEASEAILALKPVTFHYKSDTKGTPQFGLIAEEVAEVSPDLVVRDKNGEILTVRYDQVNAMLLNEFLKEHKTVRELKFTVQRQEALIAQQQKGMDALIAHIKEQDSKIQKVSDQVEMNKAAPKIVFNNP